MNPIENISLYLENHPYVFYAVLFCLILAMNIFYRFRQGDDWGDALFYSIPNAVILSAALIYGDRQRRKNLANKKKIDEYLNKEKES